MGHLLRTSNGLEKTLVTPLEGEILNCLVKDTVIRILLVFMGLSIVEPVIVK